MGCPLSSIIAGDSSWNLDLLRLWVSEEVINNIVGVPPPHSSSGPDNIVWGATSTGSFSLKCAYGNIRGGALNLKERIWELPWRFKGPQQIRFFLWLALKHRLLTKVKRMVRLDLTKALQQLEVLWAIIMMGGSWGSANIWVIV
ncbi:hypothetical protein J1N35_023176 [Gossypium stocksii]|uniref:Reverse transcriptase zinc-binding domain-containing protein n=1 Tax=Gossypium stocksii TaxID=47602 RepID=A0A9D3VHV2_9ROSI|nr:hypothetical protein J1N35_023176 [Gossypium stocksii]